MLPSGNDSAHALAEFFGPKLKEESEKNEKLELEKKAKNKDNS